MVALVWVCWYQKFGVGTEVIVVDFKLDGYCQS